MEDEDDFDSEEGAPEDDGDDKDADEEVNPNI
jgi:hypothetical protein